MWDRDRRYVGKFLATKPLTPGLRIEWHNNRYCVVKINCDFLSGKRAGEVSELVGGGSMGSTTIGRGWAGLRGYS